MSEAENLSLVVDAHFHKDWPLLGLAVVPLACILGNSLVIAAVWTTKSLQTPTNYLLVSLACADLLIGVAVMPFNIYMSVNGLHWHLPAVTCYIYCVLDVAASTASIIHLVLISMDRLVAATKPAEYKTPKHKRRVYIAIGLTWVFSVCLSLPLVTGFNDATRYFLLHEHHCGIYSPYYMLCSSIFAFYLPCLIMSITYGFIFYTLKKRLRSIQLQEMAGGQFLGFGADVGNITTSAIETVIGVEAKNRNMISWEKPLLRKIEETAAEHASSLNDSEREQLQTILEAVHPSSSGSQDLPSQECTTYDEEDERSDRPSSVLLEAVTLRQQYSETYCSSLALEVPKRCFNTKLATRRFSEALQSTLQGKGKRISIIVGDSPSGEEPPNGRFGSKLKAHDKSNIRRHSYQPPGSVTPDELEDKNRLRPQNLRGKAMRRLSEIISDWERPSRSSLSQMYSFARRESVYIARKKLAGLKDWALDLLAKLKSKQGMAIRRETRATKLVATVMGVFLICWLPFFSLNMFKVYRLFSNSWPSELEVLFHWFSALGYLNSSLNFVIYSAINKKFRSSFRRLVGFGRSHNSRDSWKLPSAAKPSTKRKRAKKPQGQPLAAMADRHKGKMMRNGSGTPFRTKKGTFGNQAGLKGPFNLLNRHFSLKKPVIVIDEVSVPSPANISISADGNTTYRQSSDDCMRRSSSEIIGGITYPSNHESRRGSAMSNSSASLQLHDMHQIALQSYQEGEIFV